MWIGCGLGVDWIWVGNGLDVDWITVCPEESGGLGTPRPSAEIQGNAESILNGTGKVVTKRGKNVTSSSILFCKSN